MNRQYIGARYVPKFADPIEWDNLRSYEALTIVSYLNNSYTSKKPVPASVGNPADNPDYWVITGNYNSQVEQYRREVDELKNYVTPQMFGAIGDGITDDTKSIQSAINYCVENNMPLYFPNKRYSISSTLSISGTVTNPVNNFKMFGDGIRSYGSDYFGPAIIERNGFSGNLIQLTYCKGSVIKGISFVGVGKIIGNNGLYVPYGNSNTVIMDCNFEKFYKGIYFNYGGGLNYLVGNNVSVCFTGIDFVSGGDSQLTDNYVNSCMNDSDTDDPEQGTGILIRTGSSHVNITGGKIEWNSHGIYIVGSTGVIISGVNFDYNRRGNILANSNATTDNDEIIELNIIGNYFRSGGELGSKSHIHISKNANINATICGNGFKKETGNSSLTTVCPNSVLSTEGNSSANIVFSGNDMYNGATSLGFNILGQNTVINECCNHNNLTNYTENTTNAINSARALQYFSTTVNLTEDDLYEGVYAKIISVDVSSYTNPRIIPIGMVNENEYRSGVNTCNNGGDSIVVTSTKAGTYTLRYIISYNM